MITKLFFQTYRTLHSFIFSKRKDILITVSNIAGEGGRASGDYSKMMLFRRQKTVKLPQKTDKSQVVFGPSTVICLLCCTAKNYTISEFASKIIV
jgi:hypothetical protein